MTTFNLKSTNLKNGPFNQVKKKEKYLKKNWNKQLEISHKNFLNQMRQMIKMIQPVMSSKKQNVCTITIMVSF